MFPAWLLIPPKCCEVIDYIWNLKSLFAICLELEVVDYYNNPLLLSLFPIFVKLDWFGILPDFLGLEKLVDYCIISSPALLIVDPAPLKLFVFEFYPLAGGFSPYSIESSVALWTLDLPLLNEGIDIFPG